MEFCENNNLKEFLTRNSGGFLGEIELIEEPMNADGYLTPIGMVQQPLQIYRVIY